MGSNGWQEKQRAQIAIGKFDTLTVLSHRGDLSRSLTVWSLLEVSRHTCVGRQVTRGLRDSTVHVVTCPEWKWEEVGGRLW